MKLSGFLPVTVFLLLPSAFASLQEDTKSSIGNSADPSDNVGLPEALTTTVITDGTDGFNGERILKKVGKENKGSSNKAAKDKNSSKKTAKGSKTMKSKATKSEKKKCKDIKKLEKKNKLTCVDHCSDNYLTCEGGEVVEKPMPEGQRCYENRGVDTSKGQCVLRDASHMVLSFDIMDACTNYPTLEYCSTTTDGPPYNGLNLVDGTWYWEDRVIVTYFLDTDEETGEKIWQIFYNFRFGHDKEDGRTKTYIATTDFGTTRVTKWRQMENVDGVKRIEYNCVTAPPDPITLFVEQVMFQNPALYVINDGELQLQSVDGNTMYTAELMVEAQEIGDLYLEEMEMTAETMIPVLVANEGMSSDELCAEDEELCQVEQDAEPVSKPAVMYNNVFMFDKNDFLEDGYNFDGDVEAGFTFGLIEEIENILLDQIDERMCFEFYFQEYNNVTDTGVPFYTRAMLTKDFPQTTDLPEVDSEGLERARRNLERMLQRRLEFDEEENWTKLSEEDFVEGDLNPIPISAPQLIEDFTEGLSDENKEILLTAFLGNGPGLPEARELLATFVRIDDILTDIYGFLDRSEDGLIAVYDLIQNVEKIRPLVEELRRLVFAIDIGLTLAGLITQIKPFLVPVRNAVKRVDVQLKKAETKLKDFERRRIDPNKPKVQRALNTTEQAKGKIARIAYVHEQLFITPLNVTRNCGPVNTAAGFINDKTGAVTDAVLDVAEDITDFFNLIDNIRQTIQTPIDLLNSLLSGVLSITDNVEFLDPILAPFNAFLNERLSVSIPGPFCTSRKRLDISYPCGVNSCCKSTFFGRVCWPCGVRFCRKVTYITIPSWCRKTFSYTVKQILDGIRGIADFIFAPFNILINEAIEGILNAAGVDLNSLPIPGLGVSLDELTVGNLLPAGLDFFDLANKIPEPYGKFANPDLIRHVFEADSFNAEIVTTVLDKLEFFDSFSPICASTT